MAHFLYVALPINVGELDLIKLLKERDVEIGLLAPELASIVQDDWLSQLSLDVLKEDIEDLAGPDYGDPSKLMADLELLLRAIRQTLEDARLTRISRHIWIDLPNILLMETFEGQDAELYRPVGLSRAKTLDRRLEVRPGYRSAGSERRSRLDLSRAALTSTQLYGLRYR